MCAVLSSAAAGLSAKAPEELAAELLSGGGVQPLVRNLVSGATRELSSSGSEMRTALQSAVQAAVGGALGTDGFSAAAHVDTVFGDGVLLRRVAGEQCGGNVAEVLMHTGAMAYLQPGAMLRERRLATNDLVAVVSAALRRQSGGGTVRDLAGRLGGDEHAALVRDMLGPVR